MWQSAKNAANTETAVVGENEIFWQEIIASGTTIKAEIAKQIQSQFTSI